jgi:outer membrane protein OmpA-like peptidoglycan-associated protein
MAFELFLRRGLMAILWVSSLVLLQGCIATRGWVGEQMNPVNDRIAKLEGQLGQVDSRLPPIENRLTAAESRAAQADSKADQGLSRIANLRLEKRLEMDLKDGVLYRVNSAALTAAGKKNIDSFLSDLKGGVHGGQMFIIGGHADSTGAGRYNYQLARARAESVAQYLILEKKIDPMQVVTVSFGESSPMADNQTRDGREKNRRVEIRVFTEIITAGSSMSTAQR